MYADGRKCKVFFNLEKRRVAIPLLPKVKQELERMEKLGVISKLTSQKIMCGFNSVELNM